LALFIESQQIFNLREAAHVALSHRPAFGFKYLAEPDSLQGTEDSPVALGFDPKRMTMLYEFGRKTGEKPSAWSEGLPPLDGDPAPVAAVNSSDHRQAPATNIR
jgi:hypothetical protein